MSLRDVIEQAKHEYGSNLDNLTVLSPQKEPYRLDTPANRTRAEWLVRQMDLAGIMDNDTPIHNRGVFYAVLAHAETVGLDGSKFINTASHWALIENASMAARWLGLLAWDKIIDARNEEPIIRVTSEHKPFASLEARVYSLPNADAFAPYVSLYGFKRRQPYRIALYGEKTSLANVLKPISEEFNTDLYLPSGEISNTQLACMARAAADDGRPLVVLVFADCDPAGYQMAVSIGHKLRAFRDSLYPSLQFQLHAPALTVEQVKTLRLPSTPLKESELRAVGWRTRYGVEQTEIDALATLQPAILRKIAKAAITPFYDQDLASRITLAQRDWLGAANEKLAAALGEQLLADRAARIESIIEQLKTEADTMDTQLRHLSLELPPFELPSADISSEIQPPPLVSSDLSFSDHIRTLRARKDYSTGGEE